MLCVSTLTPAERDEDTQGERKAGQLEDPQRLSGTDKDRDQKTISNTHKYFLSRRFITANITNTDKNKALKGKSSSKSAEIDNMN